MPHNKPEKIHNQQNNDSIREEHIAVRPEKAAKRAPNLNGIPKQES
ncbi:hypothetical protein QP794_32875 [Paenibacillus sp. UMB7766-LJ446]|jgi:hypothetical protein|uniref:Uncharacterized protein n=1 Tax=Paenibacillus vandeheii TaxID=3035917 RepID=A0ABT8JKM2_9BACL|nr:MULTISPECIES: hypothetical protein [Paenibacillus]MDK8194883.1 hypothetical protein [Paenibacillus sp. UMB7766-LJ446]MDN4605696.1 hypothetical protein [Paenibacillus vandeheii]MDN8591836.1 hypothetical protein [Paenibacillus sp. 11B]